MEDTKTIVVNNNEYISNNSLRTLLKGDTGFQGEPGTDGVDGKSAYEIWLEQGNEGTEQDFLNSLQGRDGKDGIDGQNGKDGQNGADGINGQDGVSPLATITQTSEGATISIIDKNGTTSVEIKNGKDGTNGVDGKDGVNGTNGKDGTNGVDGKDGKNYSVEVVESATTTLEIQPNKFYRFGEVTELNLTLAEITDTTQLNEYMFEFVSGSTATTLTLPDTIKWLETPTIEANKTYQCSIVDNIGILVGVANV